MSPREQSEATLKEAFPTIDATIIKAVLTASGGKLEPAFNALLGKLIIISTLKTRIDICDQGMSDPNAQVEPAAPPQPPQPARLPEAPTTTPQNQLEADELYARQLAEHYRGAASRREETGARGNRREPYMPARQRETGLKPNELHEDEHSFLDGMTIDLPSSCSMSVLKSSQMTSP